MPSATVPLTKYDIASLVLKDGATPTPVDLDLLTYADHTFTADRMVNLFEEIAIYAGQTYLGSRRGAPAPINLTFSMYMTSVASADTADTNGNPFDFIARTNGFSGNTNANTAGYDFDMVDITVTMTTAGVSQTLTYDKCTCVATVNADEPNKIDFTAVCRGGVTRT
ncbi:hypothetical protein [Herbaspirillum sp.]|uniref:hypothetical protein n=1 Tax=Herbaspirillum sp. TaxID=1890675 RepID=UPI000C11B147|nr:hypothetical protein [Herbaspirillum sp.]MBO13885.1 hypothetical protein [Herbaspirillum sp.]|tara:strand:- start:186 stop:686 length:501 start_codon:yes stop_codon:yes gene_type:complete